MSNCGCDEPRGAGIRPGYIKKLVCSKPVPPVKLETFVYQAQLGDDEGQYKPEFGKFHNTVVVYLANDAIYLYDAEGQYTLVAKRGQVEAGDTGYIDGDTVNAVKEALEEMDEELAQQIADEATARDEADAALQENIENEATAREEKDQELEEAIEAEATERKDAIDGLQEDLDEETKNREEEDNNLQSQIDAMAASTDVIDVVDTHADLESYDTQNVHLNDIIKVLNDETHDGAITYYRWDGNQWNYVGSTGPYYTKAEADEKFATVEQVEGEYATIAYVDEKIGEIDQALQDLNTGEGV